MFLYPQRIYWYITCILSVPQRQEPIFVDWVYNSKLQPPQYLLLKILTTNLHIRRLEYPTSIITNAETLLTTDIVLKSVSLNIPVFGDA